jgi:hypothetical protein
MRVGQPAVKEWQALYSRSAKCESVVWSPERNRLFGPHMPLRGCATNTIAVARPGTATALLAVMIAALLFINLDIDVVDGARSRHRSAIE